jgi:DNA-binding MarR family transcriptional regulator
MEPIQSRSGASAVKPPARDEPARKPDAQQRLIAEILALLAVVSDRLEPGTGDMKHWMAGQTDNPAILEILQDSTLITLRVVDAIGRLEPVNGITISRETRIPKGSVSKITRRLIGQKLARKKPRANNKKEVLFALTPLGQELYQVHRAFDAQMEAGFVRFLQRYEARDLRFLTRLLEDMRQASFLDVEL